MSQDTIIGDPLDRVEGQAKVTGNARYPADKQIANVTHGVLVESTIANGRITDIDIQAAEEAPGVIRVFTHHNMPEVGDAGIFPLEGTAGQGFMPLQDENIHFAGQHIALVVAETLEQAKHAASLVDASYEEEPAVTTFSNALDQAYDSGIPTETRGDPEQAFNDAAVQIDEQYTTPPNHHNPIEPHNATAVWNDGQLTVHVPSQWVVGKRGVLSERLGIPEDRIRVVSEHVGGSFGCKIFGWAHTTLAAVAARELNRPVKIVLTRSQMYTSIGYRPASAQRIRLGATEDGDVTATLHDTTSQTSPTDNYAEMGLPMMTQMLYDCPNLDTSLQLASVNASTPTWMRSPGEAQGSFVLESAMDELAAELGMDPLELRLKNYAEKDPESGREWSSKALRQCYQQGAEQFGWDERTHAPRSMRDGDKLVGWGMATTTYPAYRTPASARIRLNADGSAHVQTAAHEFGNGSRTVLSMIAAETLGIGPDLISFEMGDTELPKSPNSSGSRTTLNVGAAVEKTAMAVQSDLLDLAVNDEESPLHGSAEQDIAVKDGRMFLENNHEIGETYQTLLQRQGKDRVEAYRETSPPGMDESSKNLLFSGADAFGTGDPTERSRHSFGAQFCEVKVDPDLGTVDVTRFVGVFDAGRIINQKTAKSQLRGGIIMGIGMALLEETVTDSERGRIVNDNLEKYLMPTNADVPDIEVSCVSEEDPDTPLGAKPVGELSMNGVAAAVANAVYHATGKRIRSLPITVDKVLEQKDAT